MESPHKFAFKVWMYHKTKLATYMYSDHSLTWVAWSYSGNYLHPMFKGCDSNCEINIEIETVIENRVCEIVGHCYYSFQALS